ncbi:MAG: VCBS repeat-containing protein, partial [Deltaproteobacteria bacterium]|nr:VCBS repeat-containing protein [Deltaproteobacteria bacterium]
MRLRGPIETALAFAFALAASGLVPSSVLAQTCYIHPYPRVSDPYGCCYSCARFCERDNAHRGTDYYAPGDNVPVPAVADGVVTLAGPAGDLGWRVEIAHPDGVYSTACHMQTGSLRVGVGDRVSRGQTIGIQGETGYAFGEHVHLVMSYAHNAAPYRSAPSFDAWAYIQAHLVCRPDRDGDGSYEGDDCDDADPRRRPGGTETCDGRDNDCDPRVDESLRRACGSDVGTCRIGEQTCSAGDWGSCVGEVAPVEETCDRRDDDCDGASDEDRVCDHEDAALALLVLSPASSDVDGDGDADACLRTVDGFECLTSARFGFEGTVRGPRMATESGWDERAAYTSIRMGDVDGDGRDDVCAREGDRFRCWRATGQGFDVVGASLPTGAPSPSARTTETWLPDVDGDGRVDLCARDVDGLRCLQSGDGTTVALSALADARGFDDVIRHGSIRFGDVDGDGRDDVCARLEEGLACWISEAAGFTTRWQSSVLGDEVPSTHAGSWQLADVNGDGRDDACARTSEGFGCWLADDASFGRFVRGPSMGDDDGFADRSVYASLRMGDLDGDGRADVCARLPSGVRCWRASGEGFDRAIEGPALSDAEGWSAPARVESLRLADVDGDGLADLCARDVDALRCWLSEGTHFERQWRALEWNAAAGHDRPSSARTFTLGSGGARVPPALRGAFDCGAQGRAGPPWAVALSLVALSLARRRGR